MDWYLEALSDLSIGIREKYEWELKFLLEFSMLGDAVLANANNLDWRLQRAEQVVLILER